MIVSVCLLHSRRRGQQTVALRTLIIIIIIHYYYYYYHSLLLLVLAVLLRNEKRRGLALFALPHHHLRHCTVAPQQTQLLSPGCDLGWMMCGADTPKVLILYIVYILWALPHSLGSCMYRWTAK